MSIISFFFSHIDNEIEVFYIKSWNICTYSVYFKSKKELNFNRFVDPNILGASYIRIYESIEFRSFSLTSYQLSKYLQAQREKMTMIEIFRGTSVTFIFATLKQCEEQT